MDFSGISQLLDSVMQGISPVWWGAGVAILIALLVLIILVLRRKPPVPQSEIPAERQPDGQNREDISAAVEVSVLPETDGQIPQKSEAEPQKAPVEPQPAAEPGGTGLFGRLKNGLSKTRRSFADNLDHIFSGRRRMDEEALEELEELLITSDIGVQTATQLVERVSARSNELSGSDGLKQILKEEILAVLETGNTVVDNPEARPRVIMVVGVNGVGKTTTIGKLAARYTASGQKVLLAAADTFRAAAIEQLSIWAQRAGADIVKHRDGSDPAAVAYDSIEAALARGTDIVLVDTAGRLHTKVNLMEELKKMRRTISKRLPGAPHDILLVLDATTGQNALSQAGMFHEALGITAICLTKLDGTAKGGIVIGVCNALQVPLAYIGVGESVKDLQDFDPARFTEALF